MSAHVTVHGTLLPNGTLELDQKLPLPAGRVQVTVLPVPSAPQLERFWIMMEGIWADLRTSGRPARSREEIDAEIEALREEAEREMSAVERLHDECRHARDQPGDGEVQAR